jgi:hypothetical protein
VHIGFPDAGGSVLSDSLDVNDRLSRVFGRAVALSSAAPAAPSLEEYWPDIDGLAHRETVSDETIGIGAPSGTFFDFSAIHLVTTATLATLARAHPQGRFDWRRFRPNIIAESGATGTPGGRYHILAQAAKPLNFAFVNGKWFNGSRSGTDLEKVRCD